MLRHQLNASWMWWGTFQGPHHFFCQWKLSSCGFNYYQIEWRQIVQKIVLNVCSCDTLSVASFKWHPLMLMHWMKWMWFLPFNIKPFHKLRLIARFVFQFQNVLLHTSNGSPYTFECVFFCSFGLHCIASMEVTQLNHQIYDARILEMFCSKCVFHF